MWGCEFREIAYLLYSGLFTEPNQFSSKLLLQELFTLKQIGQKKLTKQIFSITLNSFPLSKMIGKRESDSELTRQPYTDNISAFVCLIYRY